MVTEDLYFQREEEIKQCDELIFCSFEALGCHLNVGLPNNLESMGHKRAGG